MSAPHDLLMDAISCNAEQARLIYNPSVEIDSALEHAICAARLIPPGPARDHVRALAAILTHVQASNGTEGTRVRDAAGHVNGRTARDPYAYQRLASTLRPELARLCNPLTGPDRRREATSFVRSILAGAPREKVGTRTRPNVQLRHELGVRKYSELLTVIEGVPV